MSSACIHSSTDWGAKKEQCAFVYSPSVFCICLLVVRLLPPLPLPRSVADCVAASLLSLPPSAVVCRIDSFVVFDFVVCRVSCVMRHARCVMRHAVLAHRVQGAGAQADRAHSKRGLEGRKPRPRGKT